MSFPKAKIKRFNDIPGKLVFVFNFCVFGLFNTYSDFVCVFGGIFLCFVLEGILFMDLRYFFRSSDLLY